MPEIQLTFQEYSALARSTLLLSEVQCKYKMCSSLAKSTVLYPEVQCTCRRYSAPDNVLINKMHVLLCHN